MNRRKEIPTDETFGKRFLIGLIICATSGAGLALILILMGLIAYYRRKYGW